MSSLPATLRIPGYVFVHAGLRPGIPVEEQSEDDMFWIRDEFFEAAANPEYCVVHGHTPHREPMMGDGRIGIDTGAFATGILTAVRLRPGEPPAFLSAGPTLVAAEVSDRPLIPALAGRLSTQTGSWHARNRD
jgi:serine/threonine protein phosphatase 1